MSGPQLANDEHSCFIVEEEIEARTAIYEELKLHDSRRGFLKIPVAVELLDMKS